MAEKKAKTVDEAIEQVAEDSAQGMGGFKDALAKAQQAMESARTSMKDVYGSAVEKTHEAAEKTHHYMVEAKKHLNEARDAMSELAAKTREQAEALYSKTKTQYESLSIRSKEMYTLVKDKVAEVDFKQKGDQVLEYIRSNPGKSVLIALAAGFFVGYLTRPRD